jgi:hypothetical protein
MMGSRPGQGEIRSEPDQTAPDTEQQDDGVGSLFGSAQEEVLQQFRFKMANVPRHLSKDQRAAATRALMDEMLVCMSSLSKMAAKRRQSPANRRPFKFRHGASPRHNHLQIGAA